MAALSFLESLLIDSKEINKLISTNVKEPSVEGSFIFFTLSEIRRALCLAFVFVVLLKSL
jgi:hypothetical protein